MRNSRIQPLPTLAGLSDVTLSPDPANTNDILQWNGSTWENRNELTIANINLTGYSADSVLYIGDDGYIDEDPPYLVYDDGIKTLKIANDLTLSSGKITTDSGLLEFGNDNLQTTGQVKGATLLATTSVGIGVGTPTMTFSHVGSSPTWTAISGVISSTISWNGTIWTFANGVDIETGSLLFSGDGDIGDGNLNNPTDGYFDGDLEIGGDVGIGTTIGTNTLLNIADSGTITGGTYAGIKLLPTVTLGDTSSFVWMDLSGQLTTAGFTTPIVTGIASASIIQGKTGSVITTLTGIMSNLQAVTSKGQTHTIIQADLVRAEAMTKGGGTTVATLTGLRIEEQTVGTTNWSILVEGGNSHLGDKVRISSADSNVPTNDLEVNGAVSFESTLNVTGVTTLSGNAYPTITGTSGQLLETNGSGTLSWATRRAYGELYSEGDNLKTATSLSFTQVDGTATSSTSSGSVTDTQTINQTYYQVAEGGGASTDWVVDFTFDLDNDPGKVELVGRYDASAGAHNIKIQAYNYTTVGWDNFTVSASDIPNSGSTDVVYTFDYADLSGSISDYTNVSDEAQVRIEHASLGNANHDFYIDYIAIFERGITITTAGTYQVVDGLTAGQSDGVTLTAANGTMTIVTAGKYRVDMSVSFSGTDNAIFEGHIFVDGSIQTNIGAKRKLGSDGDVGSTTFTGILDLAATDIVDVRFTSDSSGNYASIENINWNMTLL